jgi:hypothetical protein
MLWNAKKVVNPSYFRNINSKLITYFLMDNFAQNKNEYMN